MLLQFHEPLTSGPPDWGAVPLDTPGGGAHFRGVSYLPFSITCLPLPTRLREPLMTGAKRLTSLCFVLFAVVVWAPALRAQQASAELGKTLFMRRSCSGCHAIGKGGHMAGPDLKGVTQRRSPDWLKSWLKSPDTMVMSRKSTRLNSSH